MDNEDNADKLTQARSSSDAKSLVKRIYQSICPCFLPQPYLTGTRGGSSQNHHHYLETTQRVSQKLDSMMSSQDQRSIITGVPNPLYKTVIQHANRLLQEYDQSLDKSTIKKWHSYSIYEYKQNEIVPIGTSRGRILAKINTVRVDASANAKKLTSKSKRHDRSDTFGNTNVDKNWDRRYLLFERFDQGISLDEKSWNSATPQAIAQHIASKIKCETILDGFCGTGGCSIKFSNTCSRVISNDKSLTKLQCLKTNAKVYCAENIEMLNQDFLKLESIEPDVVYLAPPYNSEELLLNNCIDPYEMRPPLNGIFAKAIQLSKSIVMLLPPNINVKKLGEMIAREYIDSKTPSSTCSVKIEKIFFMSQLRYLTVYLGFIIEKEINLNDELCYVYDYLKEGSKKIFNHKKIIRELREKYGMISLLNFLFDLDKVQESGTLIEKLYFYIKSNNLIGEERLAKLIKEQNEEVERYSRKKIPLVSQVEIMEEQKYMGDDKEETDKERTLSYYSGASVNKMLVEDNEVNSPEKRQTNFSNAEYRVSDSQEIPRSYTIEFCPTDFMSRSSRQSSEFGEFESYK